MLPSSVLFSSSGLCNFLTVLRPVYHCRVFMAHLSWIVQISQHTNKSYTRHGSGLWMATVTSWSSYTTSAGLLNILRSEKWTDSWLLNPYRFSSPCSELHENESILKTENNLHLLSNRSAPWVPSARTRAQRRNRAGNILPFFYYAEAATLYVTCQLAQYKVSKTYLL